MIHHLRATNRAVAAGLLAVTPLLLACSKGPEEAASTPAGGGAAALLSRADEIRAQNDQELAESGGNASIAETLGAMRTAPRLPLSQLGYTVGDPRAPVQVVEFSDFGCGYCRQFHLETWPELFRLYVETGKVEWKYVPILLGIFGPNAELAAVAGDCAIDQGVFPYVRDRLFRDQREWKSSRDARATLRSLVEQEGVDVERWDACFDGGGREARILAGTRHAAQAGLRGTPTFFVLGEGVIPGAVPLELFKQILDEIHAKRTQ